jgi:uncharacterized membrane protein YfhO
MFAVETSLRARKPSPGDGAAIGFLLLLNAIYFLPALITANGAILSAPGTDIWYEYFYWRKFAYENLAKGELPLWNPYIFSGTPFMAGMQSAIFYPLNFIFLLLDVPSAVNLSIAIHCFLASLFTYCYVRYIGISHTGALLSAISFAYGTPYFLHIFAGHLSNLCTMIWLPLIFLAIELFLDKRQLRYAIWGGIALAMQILAGHIQYVFYSVIISSIYFVLNVIVRRREGKTCFLLAGFSGLIVIGVLLSAVQLLPAWELTQNSAREGATYQWISQFSLPPEGLITLLIPNFFGDNLVTPYWGKSLQWEVSVYVGVIPLFLAVAACVFGASGKVKHVSLLAAAALLLALGKYTPLLLILYNYVPGFGMFRGLAKFVFVFSFAVAVLAGWGADKAATLAAAGDTKLKKFSYVLLAGAILSIVLSLITTFFDKYRWAPMVASYVTSETWYYQPPPITNEFVQGSINTALHSLFRSCFIAILLAVLLWAWSTTKNRLNRLVPAILVGLTSLDLWLFGAPYLVSFDPQQLRVDGDLKSFLSRDLEPFRIATPVDRLLNVGMSEGIEGVGGYEPLMVKRYSEILSLAEGRPIEKRVVVARIEKFSPLLNLLNVKYYVVAAPDQRIQPEIEPVFQNSNYKIYHNPYALPRSFVVHEVRVVEEPREVLRQMGNPGFNPTLTAIVEEKVESLPSDVNTQSSPPSFVERSLNRVLLEATLDRAGLLVLADVFYPGWKCFVDGKETNIYRANYVMRGIFVPAGRHRVEFRYEPLSFKVGVVLSLASLILAAGFLIRHRVKV